MIVILAEKTSARDNFLTALGGNKKTHEGVYDGEQFRIAASSGHLFELMQPGKQDEAQADQLSSWDLSSMPWEHKNFKWKKGLRTGRGNPKGTLEQIQRDISDADEVVIATDDDVSGEGELLAWEILLALGWAGKTTRMYFVDESVKEVRKAFENRREIPSVAKDGDYQKALARQRFDFLSIQYTRVATTLAKRRGLPYKSILRQGRLKSVIVSLVGEQQKAYEEYVKKPYFEVRYKDEAGNIYKRDPEKEKTQIRFDKKEDADLSGFDPSDVVVKSKTVKHTAPRRLLDLAGIVAIMAEKGVKAKETTDTYQKMYESHVVSYPRTEDKTITPEQFSDLLPLADKIAEVAGVDPKLLTHRTPRKTHVKAQGSHGANRPGTSVPKSLDDLRSFGPAAPEIYKLVAKSYLAMLAEDYEYEQQKGCIKDHPEFEGVSNVPLKQGFREVFDTEKEDAAKPLGTRAESFVYEGANARPQRPTVKWLVKRLEKYNVGTGATRSKTIADVTDGSKEKKASQLMTEKKGVLALTDIGKISSILIKGTKIASPEVTEHLFAEMQRVGNFELKKEQVIDELDDLLISDKDIMEKNCKELPKMEDSDRILGVCPLCGEDVVEYPKSYSCSGWKEGCKFTLWKEVSGHTLTREEALKILEGGKTAPVTLKSKSGKSYKASLYFDKENMRMTARRPSVGKCPLCGKDVIESEKAFGCSGWKEGCKFVLWKDSFGGKLTEADAKAILETGETGEKDLVSKAGKPYRAKIVYDKEEQKMKLAFPEKKAVGACPMCGKEVFDRGNFFGCSGYKDGCEFTLPKTISGHTLTEKEAALILAGEATESIRFTSKKSGKRFNARLKYNKDEKKLDMMFDN